MARCWPAFQTQRPQRYALCMHFAFSPKWCKGRNWRQKGLYVKELVPQGFLGELHLPSAIHQHWEQLRHLVVKKKTCLGESLSQDSEEERDLVVSFSESTPESSSASLIEMIENLEKIELQNEDFKSHRFCLENMTEDDSASFYTGFPNMETFQATLTYLDPGKHGENIVIGIHLNPSLMRIFTRIL